MSKTDSIYQQLRSHLAYLKLTASAEALPAALDTALKTKQNPTEFLEALLRIEVDATEARRLGVVSRVVPAHQLDSTVDEVVADLAARSPVVLQMGRDAFYAVEDMAFDPALDVLQDGLRSVAATDDAAEGG